MKVCTKCKIEKELSEFYLIKSSGNYRGSCKKCCYKLSTINKNKNRDEHLRYHKEYYINNKTILDKKNREYAKKNIESVAEYKKKWYESNKEKLAEKAKIYREENKEKLAVSAKIYYKNNREKISEYKTYYAYKRRNTDPLFKFKDTLRSRIRYAFKRTFWNKGSNRILLGCNYETAFKYLERKFTKGMSWENHGEWHIDHIIPLASANTEEELIKLCHYTNLQPLWAIDNLKKSDKTIETQLILRI